MNLKSVHIGTLIRQKFEERNLSVAQFAEAIHCSRSNVYHIFEAKSIDTDKLLLISSALNHDFFKEYSFETPQNKHIQLTLDIELMGEKVIIKQL